MLAHRLFYAATGFFVLGVGLGIFMGVRHDFRLMHVHAHINLLGWVSLGLVGLLYMCRPQLQRGWMPQAHFWLHSVGLVVFMGGFTGRQLGGASFMAPVAAGSSMVACGVLLFALHVWQRLGAPAADPATTERNSHERLERA